MGSSVQNMYLAFILISIVSAQLPLAEHNGDFILSTLQYIHRPEVQYYHFAKITDAEQNFVGDGDGAAAYYVFVVLHKGFDDFQDVWSTLGSFPHHRPDRENTNGFYIQAEDNPTNDPHRIKTSGALHPIYIGETNDMKSRYYGHKKNLVTKFFNGEFGQKGSAYPLKDTHDLYLVWFEEEYSKGKFFVTLVQDFFLLNFDFLRNKALNAAYREKLEFGLSYKNKIEEDDEINAYHFLTLTLTQQVYRLCTTVLRPYFPEASVNELHQFCMNTPDMNLNY